LFKEVLIKIPPWKGRPSGRPSMSSQNSGLQPLWECTVGT
jgi:hypothetical protein